MVFGSVYTAAAISKNKLTSTAYSPRCDGIFWTVILAGLASSVGIAGGSSEIAGARISPDASGTANGSAEIGALSGGANDLGGVSSLIDSEPLALGRGGGGGGSWMGGTEAWRTAGACCDEDGDGGRGGAMGDSLVDGADG